VHLQSTPHTEEFIMQGKIMFVLGAATGYVFGTRTGRQGYERLKRQAKDFWQNPRVQSTVSSGQYRRQEGNGRRQRSRRKTLSHRLPYGRRGHTELVALAGQRG
jgi:hypothetical protein